MAERNIKICLGSSCFSRGNNTNLEVIKNYLAERGLAADVTFAGQLCEDICCRGPVITIDDRVYEEVSSQRLNKILREEFGC
jgi:NADH:ubiquinone oxidoreductase subunit E